MTENVSTIAANPPDVLVPGTEGVTAAEWDGKKYSYIPRFPLALDPSIELHTVFDEDIDPITYQVLRSRLWHLNMEQADTLIRVCGSMAIVYSHDLATALLTEDGDTLVVSPTIQYFSGLADMIVKWTLENRGSEGIADGDIFLQNDPFVGSAQQSDASIYAPVFWEGKIFSWIFNCSHIGDLGGVDPGGWSIHARDIYDEAVAVPPMRISQGGVLRGDVIEAFARQSRDPGMIAMGIRGGVAAIEAVRAQIREALEQYGPTVVKGVMRKMIADTSAVFQERLSLIPDGTWTERLHVTGILGERATHEETLTLSKSGTSLVCSNAGTSAQGGWGNSPFAVTRSCVVSALGTMLVPDQLGCFAGVARHVQFEPTPGTRNVPCHPAACSGIASSVLGANLAGLVVSKMILAGPAQIREHANASGALAQPLDGHMIGIDSDGEYVGVGSGGGGGTALAGGLGAFPHRDGIDAGGSWWLLGTTAGNVEGAEQSGIGLMLYRNENTDSGGPGRWRGGNGAAIALIPHKVAEAQAMYMFIDPSTNTAAGLGGGYYGLAGNYFSVADTVKRLFDQGKILSNGAAIKRDAGDQMDRLHPRATVAPVDKSTCLITEYNGGGGFGDPLKREPWRVADDVSGERISRQAAELIWGVVLSSDGDADVEATAAVRERMRQERLEKSSMFDGAEELARLERPDVLLPEATGTADVVDHRGEPSWCCADCHQLLGPAHGNFKLGAAFVEVNPHAVYPQMYPDPVEFGDPDIVLRQYFCPSCAALLSQEFCKRGAAPLQDFAITRVELR